MKHDFKKIEPKWQKKWDEAGIFQAVDNDERPKFYGLVEFPYPSGAGMHVGHIKAYSSLEVISRKRRMEDITSYSQLDLTPLDSRQRTTRSRQACTRERLQMTTLPDFPIS